MYAFICPFNSLCIKMTELTAVFVGVEDGSVDIEEEDGSDDIMEECEKDPLITTSQSTIGKRNTNVLKCIKNPNFAVVQVSFVWEVIVSRNIFTKISPMEFNNSETCGVVKAVSHLFVGGQNITRKKLGQKKYYAYGKFREAFQIFGTIYTPAR